MGAPFRSGALALLALVAASCSASPAESVAGPKYPALTGRVVDRAGLLSPPEEQSLTNASASLEKEVGPQFVIVTVDDLQGYSIEEYGVGLGRHWGIGHKSRNDGLLLIVAPKERKVRVEVGYGLEKRVSDQFAKEVIDRQIIPQFEAGHYSTGIEAGSAALIARLRSGKVDRYAWEKEAA